MVSYGTFQYQFYHVVGARVTQPSARQHDESSNVINAKLHAYALSLRRLQQL